MSNIPEFSQSVAERIGYYVYILKDPRDNQVFYVGKGCGNRIFAHVFDANFSCEPSDKLDRIRAIQAAGKDVVHLIHRHGLTEKEAFEVEASLIDFIGRLELTNLVHGVDSDERGHMKISEVIARYDAPRADIKEPVILIKVNQFYRRGIDANDLYEITRGTWKLSRRREKARFVFAVYKGIIREVYKIHRWNDVTRDNDARRDYIYKITGKIYPGGEVRSEFEGEISSELQHYVGKSTEDYQRLGAQNPIRYVNCG